MVSQKQHRWKIPFYTSSSSSSSPAKQNQNQQLLQIPVEFLCPLSGTIMADPVIISSGHTFERNCVRACVSLSFTPTLAGGVNFSAVIPNIALRSAIFNWCHRHCVGPPEPIEFHSAEKIVRDRISQSPVSEECIPVRRFSDSSSSSSSEIGISSPNLSSEEEIVTKLENTQIHEQEAALIYLRRLTRTEEQARLRLCTPRLLSSLKSLVSSRYSTLQANAAAAVVNLSLENQNKVQIVRSGILPPLIGVLRGGFPESKHHAASAIFSLSTENQNKTAIGVLGALPPLLQALSSDSEQTRQDSALALYHLSTVVSNQVKLIKLGAVHLLLTMMKSSPKISSRALLILCNLASCADGRAAMLEGGAVECFFGFLSRGQFESVAARERCLAAICLMSRGGLRFKGLAKEAGAEEVLMKMEKTGSAGGRKILEVLREKKCEEEYEDVNWEELLGLEDDFKKSS